MLMKMKHLQVFNMCVCCLKETRERIESINPTPANRRRLMNVDEAKKEKLLDCLIIIKHSNIHIDVEVIL